MYLVFLGDIPDTDEVVGVTSEEGRTISRPGEGDALDGGGFGVFTFFFGLFLLGVMEGRFQGSDTLLGFKIPDHDSGGSGSAQPVSDGREAQSVDNVTSFQRGKVVAQVEIPKHGSTVFTTRGTERTIRGDSDSVDVTSVAHEVSAEFAVVQIPDLDDAIPTSRDNEGDLEVRAETDTADPFLVTIFLDGVFALTKSVPQVDGSVARTGDDLTVISGEGDGKDVFGVTNKAASGGATVEVPKAKSTITRTREGELAIRRDGYVLNEVGVTSQTAVGNTGFTIFFSGQSPDDQGFVARSGQNHVGGFHSGSDGGNPTTVTFQFTL